MYSKDEAKQLMTDFWNGFANYTRCQEIQLKQPITWLLYKTGIKGLELKFDLERKWIRTVVEVNAKSESRRTDIYTELLKYKPILETNLTTPLIWTDSYTLPTGKLVMRAYCERTDLNFHNRTTWPELYKFMFDTMFVIQTNFSDILPILEEKFKWGYD